MPLINSAVMENIFKMQNMEKQRAEEYLEFICRAIDEIYNENAAELSFEEIYRFSYYLVLAEYGKLLYDGVESRVTQHLEKMSGEITVCPDEQLLQTLVAKFSHHRVVMSMLRDVLLYMDRTFVVEQDCLHVYELGLHVFCEVVLRNENLCSRVQTLLLDTIASERRGQLIDTSLMKNVLGMFVEVGNATGKNLYESEFESVFLETTKQFYSLESLEFMAKNTCPDYLRKVEARMLEEINRSNAYLEPVSEPKLRAVVKSELIAKHAISLVEMEGSGVESMLQSDKIDDLRRMYCLFCFVPKAAEALREAICNNIKCMGVAVIQAQQDAPDPSTFLTSLLEMQDKYNTILQKAFSGDKLAQKRIKGAFSSFINSDCRCAVYLAKYVDILLKNRIRGLGEDEMETQLDKVVMIFQFLQDKDVFENYYRNHLSKRLLSGRSVGNDAEKAMISKLKAECGYQFTSRLEGMFTDMRISRDAVENYRAAMLQRKKTKTGGLLKNADEFQLHASVLTQGYWPTSCVDMCTLPEPVALKCKEFEKVYLERHTGRKLQWQPNMGTAVLRLNLSYGRWHELHVSTYQMCILMLFNSNDELSLNTIRSSVNISDAAELERHLLSLCTSRHRILRKRSKGKGLVEDEV